MNYAFVLMALLIVTAKAQSGGTSPPSTVNPNKLSSSCAFYISLASKTPRPMISDKCFSALTADKVTTVRVALNNAIQVCLKAQCDCVKGIFSSGSCSLQPGCKDGGCKVAARNCVEAAYKVMAGITECASDNQALSQYTQTAKNNECMAKNCITTGDECYESQIEEACGVPHPARSTACINSPSMLTYVSSINCSTTEFLNYFTDTQDCSKEYCACLGGTYSSAKCSMVPTCDDSMCSQTYYRCQRAKAYKLKASATTGCKAHANYNVASVYSDCYFSACYEAVGCSNQQVTLRCPAGLAKPMSPMCESYMKLSNQYPRPNLYSTCLSAATADRITVRSALSKAQQACLKTQCDCIKGTFNATSGTCSIQPGCKDTGCKMSYRTCIEVSYNVLSSVSECSADARAWKGYTQSARDNECVSNGCTDYLNTEDCADSDILSACGVVSSSSFPSVSPNTPTTSSVPSSGNTPSNVCAAPHTFAVSSTDLDLARSDCRATASDQKEYLTRLLSCSQPCKCYGGEGGYGVCSVSPKCSQALCSATYYQCMYDAYDFILQAGEGCSKYVELSKIDTNTTCWRDACLVEYGGCTDEQYKIFCPIPSKGFMSKLMLGIEILSFVLLAIFF